MKDKINILFILESLYGGGGVERVTLNLVKYLNRSKFSPQIVVLGKSRSDISDIPQDVGVNFLGKSHARESLTALYNTFAEKNPDLIYSAKMQINIISILANLLNNRRSKIIISEHAHLSTLFHYEAIARKLKLLPTFLLASLVYRYADKIVCISKLASQDLRILLHLPLDKVVSIYNPVIDDLVLKKALLDVDHPWFIEKREKPVILAIGRLTKQKGFTYLLRAFAKVKDIIPSRLVILGEGEDYGNLLELTRSLKIDQDVAFLGFQGNSYSYMAKCDIFVLSSLWEGLPTALIEAMACGVPVISSKCPSGPEEIIIDGINGLLVPPGNSEALAEAMIRLLNNKDLAQKLSSAAKERAKDFSVEKIVPQYENLFENILADKYDETKINYINK